MGKYGMPWNADSLNNATLGSANGRQDAIMFRAPTTSTIVSVKYAGAYGSGYSLGTGGSVKCALQADSGGFPSGTDIASVTVSTPNLFPGAEESVITHTFSSPPSVTKGTLYHIVLTSADGNPVNNWISLDGTYNNPTTANSPIQPAYADNDFQMSFKADTGSAWARNSDTSASPFNIHFTDGTDYGWSVMYTPVVAALRQVGGTNDKVRMNFTPSANQLVTKMWTRLYRQSGTTQPLVIAIKNSGGTVIATGSISASAIVADTAGDAPTVGTWVSVAISPPLQLNSGSQYFFELSSPGETVLYQSYPIQTSYTGATLDNGIIGRFTDGWWEYTVNNGGTWSKEEGSGTDTAYAMQFYFETIDISITAISTSQLSTGIVKLGRLRGLINRATSFSSGIVSNLNVVLNTVPNVVGFVIRSVRS